MRILFLTAETCPTFRADVTVLFGKYLPRHGIQSDIVAGRTPGTEEPIHWGGGKAYLCDVEGGSAQGHAFGGVAIADRGVLQEHGIRVLGTPMEAIRDT
jgi:hypothetical protein